jgi:hypothetical protein
MDDIAEPFRGDDRFWRSVAASADAVAALVFAIAAAVALKLGVGGAWSFTPFVVPAVFLVRAGLAGRASSNESRASFATEDEWRDAERAAVAQVFGRMLMRNRLRPYGQAHKQNG